MLSRSGTGESSGVVFLNDVSEPGRVRYQEFDKSGFFSHSTFDNFEEALDDAWNMGYRFERPDNWFVELSMTDTWAKGMENTLWIMKKNIETFHEKNTITENCEIKKQLNQVALFLIKVIFKKVNLGSDYIREGFKNLFCLREGGVQKC